MKTLLLLLIIGLLLGCSTQPKELPDVWAIITTDKRTDTLYCDKIKRTSSLPPKWSVMRNDTIIAEYISRTISFVPLNPQ